MERHLRAKDVVTRRIAGETLLVPVHTRQRDPSDELRTAFLLLNASGESLWAQLAEPKSVEELAQHLSIEYEVGPERARDDVESFLRQLREAQMVIVQES